MAGSVLYTHSHPGADIEVADPPPVILRVTAVYTVEFYAKGAWTFSCTAIHIT